MNNIEKISTHKQIINPSGKQKVPVVFHVSKELMPDDFTINQLKTVASNKHVFKHVSALTDVHQKPGRRNPSGSVVATDGYFLPQLLDTAPNCGMRLMTTPFGTDDLKEKQIDDLFNHLVEVVPTKAYIGNPVPLKTVMDVCKEGSAGLLKFLKEDPSETENMLMGGNMFNDEKITDKDLHTALPRLFFRFAQIRLGILGAAGNHFVDLMKITDILQPDLAKKFNMKKDQYVFWIHTGSGLFGQYASYFYTPKQKEHLSQKIIYEFSRFFFLNNKIPWHKTLETELPKYKDKKEFFAINENSNLGKNYYLAHRAAGNHGFANRTMIAFNMKKSIEKIIGKKDALDLVYDMSHVYANRENHFGKDVIVNRANTTRAFGPERMKGTKFEETGEPVFMPSSMSTSAYFGVGTDENESTFFSAAHGTGKSKEKTSNVPNDKKELFQKMEKRGVKLYNAASKAVIDQDASHYKDPEIAIEGMRANGVMKPVAKMTPVAVLMY